MWLLKAYYVTTNSICGYFIRICGNSLLHDDSGNEDAGSGRDALAEAACRAHRGRLLPEVVLEVLRDEGEVADDTLFKNSLRAN